MELWELKGDDEFTPGYVIGLGGGLGIAGTLLASLAWGVEPLTALGYACVATVILDLKTFFFSPDFDKIGSNKALIAIWPCFAAVTAASILM